jgi:predicted AlkP superfamily phosphohydrolase/phosphomutase
MMRRLLTSAALAASIGATSLCVLALHLNPGLELHREVLPLGLCLFLPWALAGTVLLALTALVARALRWWPRPLRSVIDGWPYFTGLVFLALAGAPRLYWHNLLSYRHSIPVEGLRALALSSVVLSGTTLVLLAIGLDWLLFPRHSRSGAAPLAVLAPVMALAVPLAIRPEPPSPSPPVPVQLDNVGPARRVTVVGIDGLGPDDLQPSPEGGRVPSLVRLAGRGAFGPLATLRPTEGPPIWTTMLTGFLPRDHGIKSFFTYRLRLSVSEWALLPKGAFVGQLERAGLVYRRPVTSSSRKRRALWNVLDAFGIPAGLVRIWGTHPPETIRGFVLSPYFHALREDPERVAGTLHPPGLLAEVRARALGPDDVDTVLLRELADIPPGVSPLEDPALNLLAAQALAPDLSYARAAGVLRGAYDPPFFVISFHGYDVAGHAFYRYAHPELFGNVPDEEVRRYGRVLDRYASLLGQWVGEQAQGLRPGEILVVLSGHGLEPAPLGRRLFGALTGAPVATVSHTAAPEGVFLAVGDGIRAGARLGAASVLDVAPTLLYLMGLPVARDMEGRVLTEILDETFARENPVTVIPSYESLDVAPAAPGVPLEELPPLPEESE